MDMIRWLATNKVVLAVWGLGALAVLLAAIFGGGKKAEDNTAVETKVVETVTESAAPATVIAVNSTTQAVVDTTATAEVVDVVSEEVVSVTEESNSEDASAEAKTDVAEVEQTDTDKVDLSGKSSDDLLMMAREAFWDNGLDKAASLYSELITREPTVIEHKGELGNVYWRQGYPKKAAELYADIAGPMIDKGNGERVSNMVGFIGLFFPERAVTIRKQLDAQ